MLCEGNLRYDSNMPKPGAVAGRAYYLSMFFLLATALFGTAFIVLSMTSRFFKWKVGGRAVAWFFH